MTDRSRAEAQQLGGHDHSPEAAWWRAAGIDPAAAADAVAGIRVVVHTLGNVPDADAVVEALHACGLDAVHSRAMARSGDLVLLLVEDYLQPGIEDFARSHEGRSWVLARAQGETLWLGPFFRPGAACAACVIEPIARERLGADYHVDRPRLAPATAPGGAQLAAAMLARELQEIAVTGRPAVIGDAVLLVGRDLATSTRAVVRRDTCPACGTVPARR